MIAFDPGAHVYTDTAAGRRLPSVTQVLRGVGLIDASWYTDEARLRGEYVHLAIAMGDTLDRETLDPALMPYVLAWDRFLRESGAKVLTQEQRVADLALGYAGTYDALLEWNGRTGIADIKTGAVQPWTALQTAAYARCLTGPRRRWAIELHADADYRVITYSDRTDARIFLAALEVYQWQQTHS